MYTVGSLADLISGKDTPQKNAVKVKQIKTPDIVTVPLQIRPPPAKNAKPAANKRPNKKNFKKFKPLNQSFNMSQQFNQQYNQPFNQQYNQPATNFGFNNRNFNPAYNNATLKRKAPPNFNKNFANKKQKTQKTTLHTPEENNRTVFVSNVALGTNEKELKQFFAFYGVVENLRFRCVPVPDLKTHPLKALNTKNFNPNRKTMIAYVCYKTEADAINAKYANGKEFKGFHLRVHRVSEKPDFNQNNTIFLGNVSFDAEEEDLRQLFEDCGEIDTVRLLRNKLQMGIGIGFVNFKSSDAVELALQKKEVFYHDKILRIKRFNDRDNKKEPDSKKKADDGQKIRERNGIVISNCPKNATGKTVREVFQLCGEILSVRFQPNSEVVHVTFNNYDSVQNALKLTEPTLLGVKLNITLSAPLKELGTFPVYVYNLPKAINRQTLIHHFKDLGFIRHVYIDGKKTPTYACLKFVTQEAQFEALKKKITINGREITITLPKGQEDPNKSDKQNEEEIGVFVNEECKDEIKEESAEEEEKDSEEESDSNADEELIKDLKTEKTWEDDTDSSVADEEANDDQDGDNDDDNEDQDGDNDDDNEDNKVDSDNEEDDDDDDNDDDE